MTRLLFAGPAQGIGDNTRWTAPAAPAAHDRSAGWPGRETSTTDW